MASAADIPPRLLMEGIEKRFGATAALRGVRLEVRPGEVHALVGENGAGKSTLMKVLSGACIPDAGRMELDGVPYRPANPFDARRRGVAMIYQELSLAPHLTVAENILLGVEPHHGPWVSRRRMRAEAAAALQQLGVEIAPDVEVRRLSPGKRQMVEIARALAVQARVVVLDEPTSSLSGKDCEKLFALIRRLKSQGISVVYISHFLEEVQEISDRFTVLRDGETVGGGETARTRPREIAAMMVGREVEELYPNAEPRFGESLLEIQGLAGRKKPQSATLTLRRGEILGIAGLVGAGRTELLRTIFGLDEVVSGRIRVGAYLGPASPQQRWRQGMGFLSEDRKKEGLALSLSIADNLTLPKLENLGPPGIVLPSRQAAACRRWIAALAIKCRSPWQSVGTLSGGTQQKVALARLLHADADLLLLDEPTRGIDVGSKAQIYRMIVDAAQADRTPGKRAKGILLVSSYLPELLGVCHSIAVMCRGVLGPPRPASEWTEHRLMLEATGQEESS